MLKLKTQNDPVMLANGVEIPCLGYGTWQTPCDGTTERCVKEAIEAGYRHIDTAFIYGNESEVGSGLRKTGIARESVFVTSKHWVTERGYEKTLSAIDTSLRLLGLDYLDLYLIHWPCVEKCTPGWKDLNAQTWRAFETAYRDGKIRAIGVSNFEEKHIRALWETAEIRPMVNQLEFHPGYTQIGNIRWMQQNGIVAEAWSPLGSGAVLKDQTIREIAAAHGKTAAQICVRFALQNDILPLPKSTDPMRMRNNAQVFDFTLTDVEMQTLMDLPTLGFSGFRPEDAPADALANE